jgi:hypothetical protein
MRGRWEGGKGGDVLEEELKEVLPAETNVDTMGLRVDWLLGGKSRSERRDEVVRKFVERRDTGEVYDECVDLEES